MLRKFSAGLATEPVIMVEVVRSWAIQLALRLGGDAASLACITGSVAGAYYKDIPEDLFRFAHGKVNEKLGTTIRPCVRI